MATLTTSPGEAPGMDHPLTAGNEPSMEDILASIRRIIAEDQTNSLGRPGLGGLGRTARIAESVPPAALALDEPADHLMASSDDTTAKAPVEEHAGSDEGASDTFETHRPDEPALVEAPPMEQPSVDARHAPRLDPFVAAEVAAPPAAPKAEDQPLISATTGASVTSSFHALAENMLLQDKAMIERLTRDELRPLLTTWLDDNLPSIVERLVRNEIERVARGGRGRD